jgi:hypothetical protein
MVVTGCEPAHPPHHLNVAPGLVLQAARSTASIELAVDVKLQQDRRMIRRSASCLGIDPAKPKLGQIEFVNKGTDHANRIGVPCINIPPTGFTSYAQERGESHLTSDTR